MKINKSIKKAIEKQKNERRKEELQRIKEINTPFSNEEIREQIEKGDEESLGWKEKHYLGAISKLLYNQSLKK